MSKRKQYKPEFKAKVALEALRGELTVANDFLSEKLKTVDRQVRRSMVEPGRTDLSISRSTFYAIPRGESEKNLAIMGDPIASSQPLIVGIKR